MPGARAAVTTQNGVGRVRHYFRFAAARDRVSAAQEIAHGGGGDGRFGPERVEGDACRPELLRHAQDAHAHAVLGHGVGHVRAEPARLHVEGRRKHENMWIGALLKMREAGLNTHKGAARVDLVHEIEALQGGFPGPAQIDGTGVVDQNVDAAEMGCGLVRGSLNGIGVPDIDRQRQGLPTGPFNLFGGGVDGARQSWMGLPGFGRDHDIGTVAGCPQGDGLADSPAASSDE